MSFPCHGSVLMSRLCSNKLSPKLVSLTESASVSLIGPAGIGAWTTLCHVQWHLMLS